MAAFALLLEGVPAAHWWQKMAVSTWYEPDDEVVSFVYTTLYQLTNGSLIINDTGIAFVFQLISILRLCLFSLRSFNDFDEDQRT